MQACPKCGSTRLRRSRTRTHLEGLRKYLGFGLLHRCQSCGWRGWGKDSRTETLTVQDAPPPPDLKALDAALPQRRRSR